MPNQYFWDNHQRKGEEKVDTYMRIIHKIMMEGGGFKDGSQWNCESRFQYIKDYKGKNYY